MRVCVCLKDTCGDSSVKLTKDLYMPYFVLPAHGCCHSEPCRIKSSQRDIVMKMSELQRNDIFVRIFLLMCVPRVPAAQALLRALSRHPGSGPRRGEPSQRSHGDDRTRRRGKRDESWVCRPF